MSTIEANLAWSLLYVSEALFYPVLGGIVFLLATLIPRCSGHGVWTFLPGGWHCDNLISLQVLGALPWDW